MFGETISFGEGLIITALGMSVTFVALIALSFLLDLLRILFYKDPSKVPAQVTIVKEAEPQKVEAEENPEELVAVITAAIAASLQTTTHNIVVRNITRVRDVTPVWAKTSRVEQMNARF